MKSNSDKQGISAKKILTESLEEYQSFLDSISIKNLLKESLVFNENDDENGDFIENGAEMNAADMPNDMDAQADMGTSYDETSEEIPADNQEMGEENGEVASKIAAIRKAALEIVTALADRTEDPDYEFAKKIWMMCDKKNTDSKKPIENN